jgi:6-phosphogluconolactonase (cycloisomerase 2 family)
MLAACGDNSTFHPQIDPSGKYLFFGDSTINEMQIVHINTPLKKLQASGTSIPGNPNAVAFSPDGLLVFAIEKSEILVYVFTPNSGKFTAKTTINAPRVISILPWQ